MKNRISGYSRSKTYRQDTRGKITYWYITGQRISKKQFNELVKRWGLQGDDVKDGSVTVAYRRVRPDTEEEAVFNEGRA